MPRGTSASGTSSSSSALQPKPDAPSQIRKLPIKAAAVAPGIVSSLPRADGPSDPRTFPPASDAPAIETPPKPLVIAPLTPERYKVQFTVGRETHEKLRRVQDLLRHSVPNGDPGEIFDRALTLLLEHLEKTKFAHVRKQPRAPRPIAPGSRHIPAAVRRAVWKRDGGQCAFQGTQGRCPERGFLEFHHVVPYACGGPATAQNIELRCRAHNQYEAETLFPSERSRVREHPVRYDPGERPAWFQRTLEPWNHSVPEPSRSIISAPDAQEIETLRPDARRRDQAQGRAREHPDAGAARVRCH